MYTKTMTASSEMKNASSQLHITVKVAFQEFYFLNVKFILNYKTDQKIPNSKGYLIKPNLTKAFLKLCLG